MRIRRGQHGIFLWMGRRVLMGYTQARWRLPKVYRHSQSWYAQIGPFGLCLAPVIGRHWKGVA